jgi:hypothetical protein
MVNEGGGDNCTMSISYGNVKNPPELVDIYPQTVSNYTFNQNPRKYFYENICGKQFCRLDVNGLEFYDNCPYPGTIGGDVEFVHPEYPNLRVFVPPNPNLDFRLDCEEFYAQNSTFLDYGQDGVNGRSEQIVTNFATETCKSPFIIPEYIQEPKRLNEREYQCNLMGGYTGGRAKTYCERPITRELCRVGWWYHDQYCYYKFDPDTQKKFAVPIDQADISCSNLFAESEAARELDEYAQTRIVQNYLWWKPELNRQVLYRTPGVNDDTDTCTCFDQEDFQITTSCSCFDTETSDGKIIFPLCRYSIALPGVATAYAEYNIGYKTATILVNGQEGPKSSGYMAKCNCDDGSTQEICEVPTCTTQAIIESNMLPQRETIVFFGKCYTNGQGSCYNGQPMICQANYPYGPSASIMSTLPDLYVHKEHPAACPAIAALTGKYEINGVFYEGDAYFLPCGGITRGSCVVDNSTNIGKRDIHILSNYFN